MQIFYQMMKPENKPCQMTKNQYLNIDLNHQNLFAPKHLFELVSKPQGEQTEFEIEPFL